MTWYAVPNDIVGGWSVVDRNVRRSEINLKGCKACGRDAWKHAESDECPRFEPIDREAAECASEEMAFTISAGLNFLEAQPPHWRMDLLIQFGKRWNQGEENGQDDPPPG